MLRKTLISRSLAVALAVGAVAGLAYVAPTTAQAPGTGAPTRVAIANPAKIFNDMQETKDLKAKLESEAKSLGETERQKRARLQELQDQRNLLKPDSPQYADKSRELTQAAIEFQAWGQITQQEMQNSQKNQMKALFDKIQAATAQIAMQRGYDLVLADQRPEFPENLGGLNIEQLRALINQRNVLFATPNVDISADVTALLDAQFKK